MYSTYLGGSDRDEGNGIAVDLSGSKVYVTGITQSTDFPTVNPNQTDQGSFDAFVAVLDSTGSVLEFSTYLGGGDIDNGVDVAVEKVGGSGRIWVTGVTESSNFPLGGGCVSGPADAFVVMFEPNSTSTGYNLLMSECLGGSDYDDGYSIALDGSGEPYVAGRTNSTDFPTVTPIQTDQPGDDVFVTKYYWTGSQWLIDYSTYLGSPGDDFGQGIAVDVEGNAYVTGWAGAAGFPTVSPILTYQGGADAFVSKIDSSGSFLVYSTYLGDNGVDYGYDIDVNSDEEAYVTGQTNSEDFPEVDPDPTWGGRGGANDAFVTKVNSAGTAWVYSTYLGGTDSEAGRSIAADLAGNAYVAGDTFSTTTDVIPFPTVGPFQSTNMGLGEAFVTKFGSASLYECRGTPATIWGTTGADTISGTSGPDVIQALGGNDTIYGGDGDDLICGGDGSDIIYGEADDDTVYGGPASDFIYGGDNADTLWGNGARDVIWGENGADLIYGGASGDVLYGGSGADSIVGGLGDDTIYGNQQNDRIWGQNGDDTLRGGNGKDTIYGGNGIDNLYGGAGSDWIEGDADDDTIYGGTNGDDIWGDDGNDTIFGEGGPDNIRGGEGDDVIYGGTENDRLVGNQV